VAKLYRKEGSILGEGNRGLGEREGTWFGGAGGQYQRGVAFATPSITHNVENREKLKLKKKIVRQRKKKTMGRTGAKRQPIEVEHRIVDTNAVMERSRTAKGKVWKERREKYINGGSPRRERKSGWLR